MRVPATVDLIQKCKGKLETPEIRVWCHPHKIGESGDDYYQLFASFADALAFISTHKEAEPFPLIAFGGYELNIFDMQPETDTVKI